MAMKSYWLWWTDKKWIDFVLSPGFRRHHQLIMDNPYLESWTKKTKLLLDIVAKISKRAWTEYTHLIPERRSTTCLWAGNWKQLPEIKWKLQTRHPHSSVQFPFFPYWYHFPFHLSNLHWTGVHFSFDVLPSWADQGSCAYKLKFLEPSREMP